MVLFKKWRSFCAHTLSTKKLSIQVRCKLQLILNSFCSVQFHSIPFLGCQVTSVFPLLPCSHAPKLSDQHTSMPCLALSLISMPPRSHDSMLPCFLAAIHSCSHSLILPFSHALISHSPLLPYTHAPILPFFHSTILSFSHSPILPFYHFHITMCPLFHALSLSHTFLVACAKCVIIYSFTS